MMAPPVRLPRESRRGSLRRRRVRQPTKVRKRYRNTNAKNNSRMAPSGRQLAPATSDAGVRCSEESVPVGAAQDTRQRYELTEIGLCWRHDDLRLLAPLGRLPKGIEQLKNGVTNLAPPFELRSFEPKVKRKTFSVVDSSVASHERIGKVCQAFKICVIGVGNEKFSDRPVFILCFLDISFVDKNPIRSASAIRDIFNKRPLVRYLLRKHPGDVMIGACPPK
jgi:hypothetical protein